MLATFQPIETTDYQEEDMSQDLQSNEPVSSSPTNTTAAEPVFSMAEQSRAELEQQFAAGASWFYWVAGLSMVNSLIALFDGNWHFIFGLGITEVIEGIAKGLDMGMGVKVLAFVFACFVAGMFALFGYLSMRKMRWPFWVGMVIYALDALLLLLFQDWISAAVHGYVLYRMFAAVSAVKQLAALEAS
ncbi:MAG: hypothetical protein U0Y68_26155 [Blastocatellia bacterium]